MAKKKKRDRENGGRRSTAPQPRPAAPIPAGKGDAAVVGALLAGLVIIVGVVLGALESVKEMLRNLP